jgi:hypothetical protein
MSELKQKKLHDMKGFEKERNPLYERIAKDFHRVKGLVHKRTVLYEKTKTRRDSTI